MYYLFVSSSFLIFYNLLISNIHTITNASHEKNEFRLYLLMF